MKSLEDQLKDLFPEHEPSENLEIQEEQTIWMQKEPLICKYEKRKGKPITIIEGYNGAESDFKILAKEIKQLLSVGGSFKNETIIIQGDYRDKIMEILKEKGFQVKPENDYLDGSYWTLAVEMKFYFIVLFFMLFKQVKNIELISKITAIITASKKEITNSGIKRIITFKTINVARSVNFGRNIAQVNFLSFLTSETGTSSK